MTYSYDRRNAGGIFLLPIKPSDSNRVLAQRMVLHASSGKRVYLSPPSAPRHKDYVFWYDEDEMAYHAIIKGRRSSDLNGDHLAGDVLRAWVKDMR